jgi:hypothetical protein
VAWPAVAKHEGWGCVSQLDARSAASFWSSSWHTKTRVRTSCSLLPPRGHVRASAVPFLEPVRWEEWGLHDYPKIIKNPMDLGTVKVRLRTVLVSERRLGVCR